MVSRLRTVAAPCGREARRLWWDMIWVRRHLPLVLNTRLTFCFHEELTVTGSQLTAFFPTEPPGAHYETPALVKRAHTHTHRHRHTFDVNSSNRDTQDLHILRCTQPYKTYSISKKEHQSALCVPLSLVSLLVSPSCPSQDGTSLKFALSCSREPNI